MDERTGTFHVEKTMEVFHKKSHISSPFSIESILAKPNRIPSVAAKRPELNIQPWPFIISRPRAGTVLESTDMLLPPFPFPTRKRRKRYRTIFNETQIEILEQLFRTTPYPDLYQRENVAMQAGLQEERVEVWFKNKRAKARRTKRNKELLEAKNNDESPKMNETSANKDRKKESETAK